ncbi:MAG: hypothetical protein L6R41_005211 [Letrouitia leprolyta]|nr:MAG: hypothetical protein L6R41_005211 [Letrouitia leprolyta]
MPVEHERPRKSSTKNKGQVIQDLKSKKRKRSTQDDVNSPILKKKHRSKSHSRGVGDPVYSANKVKSPEASSFHLQTSSLYLPLSPIAQNHPLEGLCAEHLSPLILTYYSPLRGIILSYQNERLSSTSHQGSVQGESAPVLAQTIDEYAAPHIWLTADFLTLRPQRGNTIEGWINLQNEGNIGLVCWNFFNASIERKRLPKDWRWIAGGLDVKRAKKKLKGGDRDNDMQFNQSEDIAQTNGFRVGTEGHFEDGDGRRIEGLLRFRVKDVETSRSSGGDSGFLGIEGTLLDEAEERELREAETRDEDLGARKHRRKEQSTPYKIPGALVADIGNDVE